MNLSLDPVTRKMHSIVRVSRFLQVPRIRRTRGRSSQLAIGSYVHEFYDGSLNFGRV